ncbi:flippase [Rossellomorea vietnamensis]|uniref:flippase n=1 Tax=Rossellomorea vietnamensis TaxID=218284 RepID=UPI003D2A0ECF
MQFKTKIIDLIISSDFIKKMIEALYGRASFLIFSLLFSFVCTRLYGAEVFGVFTYSFTIVSILMIIAKSGLDSGLIYSMPKNQNKHVSFSFIFNLIISITVILVSGLLIKDAYVRMMLPLIWLYSVEQIFFGIYRAEGKIKEYYFINGFISMIVRVLLVFLLYYLLGKDEKSIAIAVYASFILSNVCYLIQNRNKFGKIIFDKDYLFYSLPLILSTVLVNLLHRIDIIMLGNMTTKTEVGIYQITVQISLTISVLLYVFNTVFAPKISSLFHQNKMEELRNLYIKSTRWLALIAIFSTALVIIFSGLILSIFGEEFVSGQNALILRGIGQFFDIAVGSVWVMLSMTGNPKFQMYANILAFVVNIILNFILIPTYGMNGAALATTISFTLISVIGYVKVSRQFNTKVFKFL